MWLRMELGIAPTPNDAVWVAGNPMLLGGVFWRVLPRNFTHLKFSMFSPENGASSKTILSFWEGNFSGANCST